jgi:hypothetical protein
MEVIFLSLVAIVAIAGYQLGEHVADRGRQGPTARSSHPLTIRPAGIVPATRTLAPEQEFDKAA